VPPKKGGLPTPWLVIREQIAEAWGIPPFEIPERGDYQHELADEVGRWIEVAILKSRYPLA